MLSGSFTILLTFMVTRHYYMAQIEKISSKAIQAQELARDNQGVSEEMEEKIHSYQTKYQEAQAKVTDLSGKNKQNEKSLKSCTTGQAKLESDVATCTKERLELKKEVATCQRKQDTCSTNLDRLKSTDKDSLKTMEQNYNQYKNTAQNCENRLKIAEHRLEDSQKQLEQVAIAQGDINKTHKGELSVLSEKYKNEIEDQRAKIKMLGTDRAEKVGKLAAQLADLRKQLDHLVGTVDKEHKDVDALVADYDAGQASD